MNEDLDDQKKLIINKNSNIQYIRGKLLGTGGFAKCFEIINQQNQQIYAAKVISKKNISQKRQRYKLLVQIKIHRQLKHKHIVQFIQTFQDKQNVYMLLQYCRNYTLKDLVKRRKRISQFQTRIYIQQIVKALIYIHSQSIIHRDLKLGNILINDQMDVKICDFGLSTRVKQQGQIKKTVCGTPNYIAPQVLQENGHSYQVDIWSIGVIMYTLLFGKPPFEDNTVEQTYQNIKTNTFKYPAPITVSNMAKDLINRILVTNPAKRISLQNILDHQFMRFKQQLPKQLPTFTLAIPPFKLMQIQNKILSLHDTHMEVTDQIQSNNNISGIQDSLVKSKLDKQPLSDSKQINNQLPGIYIYQCFFFQQTLGYLLSNGIIGIVYKDKNTNISMNVILQFGSTHYYLIKNNTQNNIIKKSLPQNNFELSHIKKLQYIQILFNFKKFFIDKYGLFKIDQFYKKYQISNNNNNNNNNNNQIIFIKKHVKLFKGQILTRLTNQIIQLHFNDLTNLSLIKQSKQIYYLNKQGKIKQINYKKCNNNKLKIKIRMFNNLIEKLSNWNNNLHHISQSNSKEKQKSAKQ